MSSPQPTSQPPTSADNSTAAARKRRREDQTVTQLRYDWQLHVSKIIQLASSCKADASNPIAMADIKSKAEEVVKNHEELRKVVGKMESVVRGKEEEVRGLVLDRGSSGCVGRRRKKRILNIDLVQN